MPQEYRGNLVSSGEIDSQAHARTQNLRMPILSRNESVSRNAQLSFQCHHKPYQNIK
jgi:hypothetical protein